MRAVTLFFFFMSLLASCQQQTRIRIIGGTVRLLSYSQYEQGVINVSEFEQGDTTLGIGIMFDVESYFVEPASGSNEPYYGAEDTIISIKAILSTKKDTMEITEYLTNSESYNRMTIPNGFTRSGRGMLKHDKNHFKAEIFDDLDDYKTRYNNRTLFDGYGYLAESGMKKEVFFWIENQEIIKLIQKNGLIEIIIVFNDRTVVLNGERTAD